MVAGALINSLESKHPSYMAWKDAWSLYRDVVHGDWDDNLKSQYLVQGLAELSSEYHKRAQLSEFLGETSIGVKRIVSSLFRDMPTRLGVPSTLKKMVDFADKRGRSIDIFMTEVAELGITYGSCHVLVDKKMAPAGVEVKTRKDEIEMGLDRPFLSVFTPLDMWNWEVDDEGRFVWVRFVCDITRQDDPRGKRTKYRVYREYTRDSWSIYRGKLDTSVETAQPSGASVPREDAVELVSTGEHGLGVVPVVTFVPLSCIEAGIGKSFIDRASHADLKKFRRDSDLQWDLFVHAHPTLKVWTRRDMGDIAVGANTYIKLEPGSQTSSDKKDKEDAEYIEIPMSAFEGHFRAIADASREVYSNMGIDPMGVVNQEGGTDSTSGVSRAWSFSTSEARLLAFIADSLEQFEYDVMRVAADWSGEGIDELQIRYPDNFDLVSALDLIKAYLQIGQSVESDLFHSSVLSRIAAQMVGDVGTDMASKMLAEIKKAGKPEVIGKPEGDRFNRNPETQKMADAGMMNENQRGREPASKENGAKSGKK